MSTKRPRRPHGFHENYHLSQAAYAQIGRIAVLSEALQFRIRSFLGTLGGHGHLGAWRAIITLAVELSENKRLNVLCALARLRLGATSELTAKVEAFAKRAQDAVDMRGQHLHSFWVHDEIDGKEGARRAKFRSDRKKGLGFMAKDERLTIEQLAARAD
jgi:hypothetical protein